VKLAPDADVVRASIVRLSPNGAFSAPAAHNGLPGDGRSPGVLFAAPEWGPWPAGVYAITVSWRDVSGEHTGTWHVELRPGFD
jgi:hypothetical protein